MYKQQQQQQEQQRHPPIDREWFENFLMLFDNFITLK
jgi:hypothetical protein